MRILIDEMLNKRDKSILWLQKETGLTYQTVWNLVNHKTASVKFETLDIICKVLNCEIEDILQAEK